MNEFGYSTKPTPKLGRYACKGTIRLQDKKALHLSQSGRDMPSFSIVNHIKTSEMLSNTHKIKWLTVMIS